MDAGLLAWARAVKRRGKIPALWFFTDAARLPDPLPVIRRLPCGISGVVFRHDGAAVRLSLGREIAAICRARRLTLVVAGDARLAARLGAGLHLRGGRRGVLKLPDLVTASAHDAAQALRARRNGADVIFISPVFATKSHSGASGLGELGWRRLARLVRPRKAAALGGMTARRLCALAPHCAAMGGIEAFF